MAQINPAGQRIEIAYYDHNDAIEPLLPRTGLILRNVEVTDGKGEWYLVQLDDAFNFSDICNTHLLVRSRWDGHDVGGPEPVSVFIALIRGAIVGDDPIEWDRCDFVAWGISRTL